MRTTTVKSRFKPRGVARLCVLGVAGLAGCQAAPAGTCRLGFATDIPVRVQHQHLIADALLNGQKTAMVVDTGAVVTTLARSSADRLHLRLEMLQGWAEGIGGAQTVYGFETRSYEIGRLHGGHFRLLASDLGSVEATGVDGLFGSDFLGAYDVDVDLPDRKVKLFKSMGDCTGQPVHVALPGPLYAVPMIAVADDGRPIVDVQVGGKTLRALIDTGSPGSVVFRDSARRIGLNLQLLTADRRFHLGGIGPGHPGAVLHVLTPVTMGEVTISNFPVAIIDQRSMQGVDMLLGLDLLSRAHPWFSFSSHSLILQVPPLASPPSPG